MKNLFYVSILVAMLVEPNARAADSSLKSLGIGRLYGMTLVAPWETEGDCQYMSRYMGGPAAYAYQVLSESEAKDQMISRGLPSDSYPMIIKSYYQPLQSCTTMRPIPGSRNIKTYLIAEKTEVYSEVFDQVKLRFSIPCDKSASQFDDEKMRVPCGEQPAKRLNWLIQVPRESSTGRMAFSGLDLLFFKRAKTGGYDTSFAYDEELAGTKTFIPGTGKNLIPLASLEEWNQHLKDHLSKYGLLQTEADKTKAEATAKYEELYGKALKGGAELKGPDGRGLRGISDAFRARAEKHVYDMTYEQTCNVADVKKYKNAMDVLIEEIRQIELMSQSLWG